MVPECVSKRGLKNNLSQMEDAIKNNNLDLVNKLLNEAYDPNEKDLSGNPLIFATENIAIIDLFLKYGLDPKITDIYGFTLSDYASNPELKEKLDIELNSIIIDPPKFTRYRATNKSSKKRAKTRKTQVQKSM